MLGEEWSVISFVDDLSGEILNGFFLLDVLGVLEFLGEE